MNWFENTDNWFNSKNLTVTNFKHFTEDDLAQVICGLYNNCSLNNDDPGIPHGYLAKQTANETLDIAEAQKIVIEMISELRHTAGWSKYHIEYL